jgi:hypothetical protein
MHIVPATLSISNSICDPDHTLISSPNPFPTGTFRANSWTEGVQGSGDHPEFFEIGAIGFVEDTGHWEPNRALGKNVARFYETRPPHSFGGLMTFNQADGTLWQGKPQRPQPRTTGGSICLNADGSIKYRKYEAPAGSGSRAYLPAVGDRVRAIIGQCHGIAVPSVAARIDFWGWVEENPEIPIVVTEGAKKSLCLLSLGYVAIALTGINGGVRRNEKIGGVKTPLIKPELNPDLARFAPKRRIILAFDQDTNNETRASVEAALGGLAFGMSEAGAASVAIATWDGRQGTCKGADDLVVNAGVEAWETAYSGAVDANIWRIQRGLANRVRRKPDLTIDGEFTEVADRLPDAGLLVMVGYKGSAKSGAIAAKVQRRSWLSLTTLRSLARDQAAGWGGEFLNDGDRFRGQLIGADGGQAAGVSVCVPSLLAARSHHADVFVLDETTAIQKTLLSSPLANKDGIRPLLIAEHDRRAMSADLVILADADLTEETIAHYEALTGHRAFYVKSTLTPLAWTGSVIDGTRGQAVAQLLKRAEKMPAERLLFVSTDERSAANQISELLESRDLTTLKITSETSADPLVQKFLGSKGGAIPELIARGYRAIVASPSVTQGFSIQRNAGSIDSVWGLYAGTSIAPDQAAQALDRVRSATVPRLIHARLRGTAYSSLSRATSTKKWIADVETTSTATARLCRLQLTPDVSSRVDAIDWRSNLLLLAGYESARNRGIGAFRDTLIANLRNEGKHISTVAATASKGSGKRVWRELKEIRDQITAVHATAVAAAPTIDSDIADKLTAQRTPLTEAENLALEKFFLSQFYRTDVCDLLVLADRSGATRREIEALEQVLDSTLAVTRSAKSINESPDNPTDWSRAALRDWVREQSGLNALIRQIVAGEVVALTTEATGPIVAFLRQYRTQVQLVMGFGNLDAIADQQLIGQLLATVGIRTKRNSRQGLYSVQTDHLTGILAILDRRKPTVTPPLNIDLIGGGVTPSDVAIFEGDRYRIRAIEGQIAYLIPLDAAENTPIEFALSVDRRELIAA